MFIQSQRLRYSFCISLCCIGWIIFADLGMSQTTQESASLLTVYRECLSQKCDLTPTLTSGSASYGLPAKTLNFLALPRDVRVKMLNDFEGSYRDDVFARLLVTILREIDTQPLMVVEPESKDESHLRYFFIKRSR